MEVEIKLHIMPSVPGGPLNFVAKLSQQVQLAGHALGGITPHEIWDLYYDTEDGRLAKNGVGLRSRLQDRQALITLKIHRSREGGLTRREEFEEPLVQERVDWVLEHIKDLTGPGPFPAQALYEGKPCGSLVPVLKVGTARLEREVGNLAHLAVDVVQYPGLAKEAFYDLEVEAVGITQGEAALRAVETDLYRLAGGHLAASKMSKLERGLKLKAEATVR